MHRWQYTVGDELHCVFDCPHFSDIRAQFPGLFQDAAGCMRMFMWHKDQKSVCHSLIALLQKAQTWTQFRPHKPGWLNGRSESLSLSLLSMQYGISNFKSDVMTSQAGSPFLNEL